MTRRAEGRVALLVGEDFGHAPARYHSDRYALTGRSGERLAALAGLSFPAGFVRAFDRSNVVEVPADWGDPARVAAGVERVLARMASEARVILLGRRVAAALRVLDLDALEWTRWRTEPWSAMVTPATMIARLPHPSGRNRWWNEPANVERAQSFMRDAVTWART